MEPSLWCVRQKEHEEYEDFQSTRDVLNSVVLDGEDAVNTLPCLVPTMATIEYQPMTELTRNNIIMSIDIM